MKGISAEEVGEDLRVGGDDGRLVSAAVCLVLRGDDRHDVLVVAEERHLGVVLPQEDIVEASLHHTPQLHGLFARLDIEQHLCRQDAARLAHQAEATQELLGGGIGRHPHICRAYLGENPLDETEGVEVSPEVGLRLGIGDGTEQVTDLDLGRHWRLA